MCVCVCVVYIYIYIYMCAYIVDLPDFKITLDLNLPLLFL